MKRLNKILLIVGCTAILGGATGTAVAVAAGRANPQVNWEEIQTTDYVIGDSYTLPSRSVTVDGKQYDSTVTLTYPDGMAVVKTQSDDSVVLDQSGIYTVTFEVRDDNSSRHTEKATFTVEDKLWTVSSEKSSVTYGTHTYVSDGSKGLLVRLAKGDTLNFNRIIDLSEIEGYTELFSAYITPDRQGTADFNAITFTFTDAYDPDCYMRVYGRRSLESGDAAKGYSYWMAGGNGQGLSGWHNGTQYKYNCDSGTNMNTSWMCCRTLGDTVKIVDANHYPIRISYNAQTRQLRTQDLYLADLDNPADHPTEDLWTGFTSGKVRLSVTAKDYSSATANFCISSLIGYDLSVENKFSEDEEPVISVDVDDSLIEISNGNKTFIPKAVVGGSYPVPEAVAFDAYAGNVRVKTEVFYNYSFGEDKRTTVAVRRGRFTTNNTGMYTIVYTATDAFGNVSRELYWVNSVKQLDTPLAIALPQGQETSAVCGEHFLAKAPVITGGSGEKQLKITATLNDTVIEADENGEFVFEEAGNWKIEYSVTDYAGINKTVSFNVSVIFSATPVFVEFPELPDYYVAGISYPVPVAYANDYSTGDVIKMTATVDIQDANGTVTYDPAQTATFIPGLSGDNAVLKLTFKAGVTELEKQVPAVVPIVKEGNNTRFYIQNMFVTDDFDKSKDDNGLKLVTKAAGDSSWVFANPVVAEGASLSVKGIQTQSHFEEMDVTFTDYRNKKIAVTMRLLVNSDGTAHISFGDTDRDVAKGFTLGKNSEGNDLDDFVFSYSYGKFKIDSIGVNVTKTDDGRDFEGFPSGKVTISSTIKGAQANAAYLVTDFDNHHISALSRDNTKPRVVISGVYGGMYNLNDVYTVTPALVSDVVDENVTCNVTVLNPNGSVASDINGVLLKDKPADREYRLKLTSYGQYRVNYVSVDWNRNKQEESRYTVNILDKVKPTILFETGYSKEVKVGDKVLLPKITVTDDHSQAENVKVYRAVRNPNGILTVLGPDYTVKNGTINYIRYKYTFKYSGEYTFVICAIDEAGNQTTLLYTVTVTE